MCNNTQKKKAAGAGKDFTLFFGVMLHFNFKCVALQVRVTYVPLWLIMWSPYALKQTLEGRRTGGLCNFLKVFHDITFANSTL